MIHYTLTTRKETDKITQRAPVNIAENSQQVQSHTSNNWGTGNISKSLRK